MPYDHLSDEAREEFLDRMHACLGDGAKYYAVFPRSQFALRYGPFTLDQVDKLVATCRGEKFPLHVTADCGAGPVNWDVLSSLYGTTIEERTTLEEYRQQTGRDMLQAGCTRGAGKADTTRQALYDPLGRYIVVMRDSALLLVGPFATEDELASHGNELQSRDGDDPRWQAITLRRSQVEAPLHVERPDHG